jgi:DnaJ-class molecular chaperone
MSCRRCHGRDSGTTDMCRRCEAEHEQEQARDEELEIGRPYADGFEPGEMEAAA